MCLLKASKAVNIKYPEPLKVGLRSMFQMSQLAFLVYMNINPGVPVFNPLNIDVCKNMINLTEIANSMCAVSGITAGKGKVK